MSSSISLKSRALNYLARRDHSKLEIINKLKPFAQLDEIMEVIRYLENVGFINDVKFICNYITYKQSKMGINRLRLELYRKIGDNSLVDQVLDEFDLDQVDTAYTLWSKKFTYPHDYNEKCKQIRFLLYRGFSIDVINRVLVRAKKID